MEKERYRNDAPGIGRYQPDLTIVDSHANPLAFLEIRHSNAKNKTYKAARQLGLPVYTAPAPKERTVQPNLINGKHWWELTNLPDTEKRKLQFNSEVAGEIMHRNSPHENRRWYEIDKLRTEDDSYYNLLRASSTELEGDGAPTFGGLIWAEAATLNCERALELENEKDEWLQEDKDISERQKLEKNIGREVLEVLTTALKEPEGFAEPLHLVVPVGRCQLSIRASLEPLSEDPKRVSWLIEELKSARSRVAQRPKWQTFQETET